MENIVNGNAFMCLTRATIISKIEEIWQS